MRLDIRIKGDPIPYNSNPVFLGVTFDERLSFNTHYANLRARALKRLNIIKFFSHRSWRIDVNTLINIYRALIGSVFDYSFFTVTSTSDTSLSLVQRVQNRAIRCIFRLEWDSPTHEQPLISGIIPVRERLIQLGSRYLLKCLVHKNKLIQILPSEYFYSRNSLLAKNDFPATPLCHFLSMLVLERATLMFLFALQTIMSAVFLNLRQIAGQLD